MRIAFVSHSFPPAQDALSNVGGMQRVAVDLCEALAALPGVHVHPIVLRTSWAQTGWRTPLFLGKLAMGLPRVLARERIDVVLFSSMVTATLAPVLRMRMGARTPTLAAIVHGLDLTTRNAAWQTLVRRGLPALDALFPVSRATADAAQIRGMPRDRITVHPNGVDPARFSRSTEVAPLPTALQSADALLLGVGRQVPRKGFLWLVREVMPKLPEGIHLVLAGDGPEHTALRESLNTLSLDNRVHLLGMVDESVLHALYSTADLFVMPNRPVEGDMEGFGVVMLEAASHGTTVVAASLEGILDVLGDGGGVLLPSGDVDRWVHAITTLLAQDDDARKGRQREALALSERFRWPAIAERVVESLRVASQRRSAA